MGRPGNQAIYSCLDHRRLWLLRQCITVTVSEFVVEKRTLWPRVCLLFMDDGQNNNSLRLGNNPVTEVDWCLNITKTALCLGIVYSELENCCVFDFWCIATLPV